MNRHYLKFFSLVLVAAFAAGCATAKPRKQEPQIDKDAQIAQLQGDLQAKDQQIQEMQYQLQSYQNALQTTSNFSSTGGGSKSGSSYIRVSGVSVKDVQRALSRAGYDPGPVDGKMGRKTKAAIKDFQRRNNLTADGIVGEKTWSYLRS
jgi:murein L,D-transpeptidase YcbB/YkuD